MIVLIGFVIEVIGVKTGYVFGSYSYGDSLGFKILEVPVTYFERSEGETKMTNVITNASRMFWIVIYSFYKLRLRD